MFFPDMWCVSIYALYISPNCKFIGFTVHCFQTNSYPGVTFFVTQFLVSKARKTRPVHGWVYWWWMYLDDGSDVSFISHSYLEGIICWDNTTSWDKIQCHLLSWTLEMVTTRTFHDEWWTNTVYPNMCRSLQIDWDKLFRSVTHVTFWYTPCTLAGINFPGVSEELYILLQCPDTAR